MITSIEKERIEKCVVQVECVNIKNEKDKDIGTGFFVEKNIVVTASHVIDKYYRNPSEYYINIIPIKAGIDKDIKVKCIINETNYNNYISILELEEKFEGIDPIKFTLGYEIQRGDDYFSFGYPYSKRVVGIPIENKVSTNINEYQSKKADWDLNISNEKLTNFAGLSGAPVIINNMLIGIIQIESNTNGQALSIGMSSIEKFKEFIPLEYCKDYSELFILKKSMQADGYKIYTINDIEIRLKESTNPSINLNFFEVDDEEFKQEFKKTLENNVHIVGRSREETLYCILNELKYSLKQEKVIIIEDEQSWNYLSGKVNGLILIPNFNVQEIVSIKNNINIFIYGEDENCTIKNKIHLRKRTRKTIIEKLENIGLKDAYDYVEKTNGLFIPLKRKLFDGRYNIWPEWKDNWQNISFVTALLCGKWTEREGDKDIVEKISGKSYDEFISDLKPFTKGSEPFIIEITGYGDKKYQLANTELAWELLDCGINKIIWDKFKDLSYKVITEVDPVFYKPLEDYYIESIKSSKSKYSNSLKYGMIRSLIFRGIYRGSDNQNEVDDIVKNILDKINSKEEWAYFSQFFTDLCEASPKSVINRLKAECQSETGLIDIFKINSNGILSRNYYTNIIWAVEQLLLYKEYAPEAIKWLFYMDNKNIEYKITNSPINTLKDIFCAWHNVSVLTSQNKILLSRNFINKYERAWKLFFGELPNNHQIINLTMSRPRYRQTEDIKIPTNKEINELYTAYANLCIENAKNYVERWIDLIGQFNIFPDIILDNALKKLSDSISEMNDIDKSIIKDKLMNELYRHRYYNNSGWAMDETHLQKIEKVLYLINFDEQEYEYIYLFQSIYNLPILNPIQYDENCSRDENEMLRKKEIKKGFESIKSNNIDLKKLIKIVDKKNYILVGNYIAEYYTNKSFDMTTYMKLLNIEGIDDVILGYIEWIYKNSDKSIIGKVKSTLKTYGEDYNFYIKILSIERLSYKEHPEIIDEDEIVKSLYWGKQIRIFNISKDRETLNWVLSELEKYGNVSSYVDCLYHGLDIFDSEEVYKYIIKLIDFKNMKNFNYIDSYYIGEIMDKVQNAFINDLNKCYKIAITEIYFKNIMEWKQMKCTQHIFKNDAKSYAEIIDIVFLHEGENKEDIQENQQKLSTYMFDLYYCALFCPCEKNGDVNLEELKEWVEKFKENLKYQKQYHLLGHQLGRLFAYSPIGKDGYYPHESIRYIIEELEDDTLRSSYVISEVNKRGVYSPDAGKTEREMALKYKENADYIRWMYPESAKIYDELYETYNRQSKFERKRAEDEW